MPKADFNRIVNKYSDYEIDKLRVVRTPLAGILQKGGKLVSKKKEGNPDKYYHLYQEMSLVNRITGDRTVALFERNQTLHGIDDRSGGLDVKQQALNVDLGDKKITLGEYFQNSKDLHEELGVSFDRYNVRTNNCQDFTRLSIRANDIDLPESTEEFINQKAEDILPAWTDRILQPITDLARVFDNFRDKFRTPVTRHVKVEPHLSHIPHQIVVE